MSSKKLILVPLALLLIFSLVLSACGGNNATAPTEVPTAVEVVEPTATEVMVEEPTATTEAMAEPTATEEMAEPTATEEAMAEPTATTAAGGETAAIDCMGAQSGDEVTMYYQWSGVEEEQLMAILQPVVDACGITISPEASRDQALLDTRIQAGTPPDIAFFNVTQLQQYQDLLVPLSDLGVHAENVPDFWQQLGTVNGQWLGLPVKADVKSIIWYNPVNFEAFGYEVPANLG